MHYKTEGRIKSFDMHGEKKATIYLPRGGTALVYMSKDYLIGGAEIHEALERPVAEFFLYNSWGKIGEAAKREALRLGLKVHSFGAFGHRLDELDGER